MDKRFLAILAVLVIVFGGIFVFSQNSTNKSKTGSSSPPSNHVLGEKTKNVTLVEYGDFQCQACLAYEPVIQQVRTVYAKDLHFQFRHLPLTSIHPNAFAAARAAEAAALQNKFWEMHDMLYNRTNWEGWTTSSNARSLFDAYAKQLGLDLPKFQADFASEQVNSTIQADLAEFSKTGRPMATPTFFLNGSYIENSKFTDQNNRPLFEKFQAVIDAEIAKQPQPNQ